MGVLELLVPGWDSVSEDKTRRNFERLNDLFNDLFGLNQALGGNRIISGIVSSTGTVVSGAGFTASRTGVGRYTVSFNTSFSAAPAVTAMPVAAGAVPWTVAATARPAVGSVTLRAVAGGADADLEFSFHAIGPV